MRKNRTSALIQRAAGQAGIPDCLHKDILRIAVAQLSASGRAHDPQQRDVVWAVDRARSKMSQRFLSALDERAAREAAA